jgi:hypothetical protein
MDPVNREQYVETFRVADAIRREHGIPEYRVGRPLETIHGICGRELFPRMAGAISAGDSVFAKVLSVLSYLTPREDGLVPDSIMRECYEVIQLYRQSLTNDDALVDMGLALAAGWNDRQAASDAERALPWPQAVRQLHQIALALIDSLFRGFHTNTISGGPREFDYPDWPIPAQYAVEIVAVFLGSDTTRVERSRDYHFLANWKPGPDEWLRLRRWLQHAIQGQPEGRIRCIQANWFREGLLYQLMHSYCMVGCGPLAFTLCHRYDGAEGEFGDSQCACGYGCDPGSHYVFTRELLFTPLVYVKDAFRRFTPAKWPLNLTARTEVYYWEGLGRCPHEATWVSERTSHLRVRSNIFPVLPDSPRGVSGRSDDNSVAQMGTSEPVAQEDTPGEVVQRERANIIRKLVRSLPLAERAVVAKVYFERAEPQVLTQEERRLLRKAKRRLRSEGADQLRADDRRA